MAALDPLVQERIYHALKADFMAGILVPGQRMDVQEIANRHRSSKTPVREAACILVGQGLLVHHRDGGFTVPPNDPAVLVELHQWHMQLQLGILARLKDSALRRTLEHFSGLGGVVTAVEVSRRATEIFVALAGATANRWSVADVRRLNERLHYSRISQTSRPSSARKELDRLIDTDVVDLQKSMRRRIEAYHMRRIDQISADG